MRDQQSLGSYSSPQSNADLIGTDKRATAEILARLRFVMKPQQTTSGNDSREKFVDSRFLAQKYSVSSRHILLLAASGTIPSFRVGTKAVRFSEAAVAAALEKNS